MVDLDGITGEIVGQALQIHRSLGPGLLEGVYEAVLARALVERGLTVERQKIVRVEYHGMIFEEGFRADLVVESRVIVELKSVEKLLPVHGKQLLSYLRLTGLPVGLLINFGALTLKEGLRRLLNNYYPAPRPQLHLKTATPLSPCPPCTPGEPCPDNPDLSSAHGLARRGTQ